MRHLLRNCLLALLLVQGAIGQDLWEELFTSRQGGNSTTTTTTTEDDPLNNATQPADGAANVTDPAVDDEPLDSVNVTQPLNGK
jgi:hypothetical protein